MGKRKAHILAFGTLTSGCGFLELPKHESIVLLMIVISTANVCNSGYVFTMLFMFYIYTKDPAVEQ